MRRIYLMLLMSALPTVPSVAKDKSVVNISRSEAVKIAERFVGDNGYADARPPPGGAIGARVY